MGPRKLKDQKYFKPGKEEKIGLIELMYSDFRTRIKSDRSVDHAVIFVSEENEVTFFVKFQKNTIIDFRIEPFDLGEGRYFLVFYPFRMPLPSKFFNSRSSRQSHQKCN